MESMEPIAMAKPAAPEMSPERPVITPVRPAVVAMIVTAAIVRQ